MLLLGLALLVSLAPVSGEPASAEQASAPSSPASARLDAGENHSCAAPASGGVRCWGFGGDGRLGYGDLATIGDNETPGSVGPVDLGVGQGAAVLSAGGSHSCAILTADASVRCWGSSGVGQLGYGNTNNLGDNESAGAGGPVDLGAGRTARAITAARGHTCAILDSGEVRCWGFGGEGPGFGGQGRLGYPGPPRDIGDNETPGSVGQLDLGRPATAISAGPDHTCAILDDSTVRCWGINFEGQLGHLSATYNVIGDNETPGSPGPVDLGAARSARAIAVGAAHSCAILDDASLRCWGDGSLGQLGYGTTQDVGDDEAPGSVGPVNLGAGRTAKAISAGDFHTCALLDNDSVRCWGWNGDGRLGYGRLEFGGLNIIGDNESPGSVGPVDLGASRTATAISAGGRHTCARLDDGNVRCWGYGASGELGNCSVVTVGDNEVPASARPVGLAAPVAGGSGCPTGGGAMSATPPPRPPSALAAKPADALAAALRAEAARLRGLRSCRSKAARHTTRETRRARRLKGFRRARAGRHIKRHRSQLRRRCLKRWGRTPGRVVGLKARATSRTKVVLSFKASGSNGARPPAARSYLVKQSRHPIRSSRAFRRAQTLCKGSCRFPTITNVGGNLTLTVGELRPSTTYYYAVAARDNVSRRPGPRSSGVRVTTP